MTSLPAKPVRPTTTSRPFSILQRVVVASAIAPLIVIVAAALAWVVGLVDRASFVDLALAAGEDPGMLTFAAMFLATPVQQVTGRTQVRVRKYLGLTFFAYAVSNYVMFLLEHPAASSASQPFLIAGLMAMIVAAPLALTSGRWWQRRLGLRRWRLLHKLTYVVGAALVAHVVLMGELELGALLIIGGFVARIPAVSRLLSRTPGRIGTGGPQPPTETRTEARTERRSPNDGAESAVLTR